MFSITFRSFYNQLGKYISSSILRGEQELEKLLKMFALSFRYKRMRQPNESFCATEFCMFVVSDETPGSRKKQIVTIKCRQCVPTH